MPHSQNGTSLEFILVLEDDPLLALDAATAVADAGFEPAITPRCGEALAMLDTTHFRGAILDFNLADGNSTAVAKRLMAMGMPFRVVSGRSADEIERSGIPASYVLSKPADYRSVANILLAGGIA